MWVILWREVFGGSILIEGRSVVLPGTRQFYIRTLDLIKVMTISIDLILAQGLNMQ